MYTAGPGCLLTYESIEALSLMSLIVKSPSSSMLSKVSCNGGHFPRVERRGVTFEDVEALSVISSIEKSLSSSRLSTGSCEGVHFILVERRVGSLLRGALQRRGSCWRGPILLWCVGELCELRIIIALLSLYTLNSTVVAEIG